MFTKLISLKYCPLNPPNIKRIEPKNVKECLLRPLGIYPETFIVFIDYFPGSKTIKSCKSLLNRPPNIYILSSKTAEDCPQRVKNDVPFSFNSLHYS